MGKIGNDIGPRRFETVTCDLETLMQNLRFSDYRMDIEDDRVELERWEPVFDEAGYIIGDTRIEIRGKKINGEVRFDDMVLKGIGSRGYRREYLFDTEPNRLKQLCGGD